MLHVKNGKVTQIKRNIPSQLRHSTPAQDHCNQLDATQTLPVRLSNH